MATTRKPATQPALNKASKPEKQNLENQHVQGQAKLSRRQATREEIERRAYELWQQRGAPHGDDQADWHRAEEELQKKQ